MICANCGTVNEGENNFCKHCGNDLKTSSADPHRTIFGSQQVSTHSNADLGFLIIAILVLVNIFIWISWTFFYSGPWNDENRILYRSLRIISTLLTVGQLLVMFIFAKRQVHKTVIGIIGLVVIVYDIYYLLPIFYSKY